MPRAPNAASFDEPEGTDVMHYLLRSALCLPLLAISACDELAVANDPVALAEVRAARTCVAAVNKQVGGGATLNTTLPIVEINQYVIDVPKANSWTCFTDDNGRAQQLIENIPR
ncbi:MAG: hypothetical protein ACJAVM_000517 [Sulfitobacter sp.]